MFNRKSPTPEVNPVLQEINALLKNGNLAQENGQNAMAMEAYQRGLALSRQHGHSPSEQVFLNSLGTVYVEAKRFEDAEQSFRQALNLANHLNQPVLIARTQNN